jgi:hypothetical protein
MTRRREWFDDAAGPLVRPYAVTRGRTSSVKHDLDLITLVVAIEPRGPLRRPEPEYEDILRVVEIPQSIAEIAAKLHLPLLVTKILIGDLIDDGLVDFRAPSPAMSAGVVDINLMRAVLDGIRKF